MRRPDRAALIEVLVAGLLVIGETADGNAAVRIDLVGPPELADAVRAVVRSDAARPLPPAAIERLTPRETQVLLHLARGRSNAEIARALHVSIETIKTHVSHILGKLALSDRTQAAIYALRHGLATSEERPPAITPR